MLKLTGPLASIPGLCCANPSDATIARIRQNLPSSVEQWEKWLECVQINGIEPQVQSSLVRTKIEIPRWVSMALEDRSNILRLRNRLRRESFKTLLRYLIEKKIDVVVLGGDSIAQEVYGDYDYRRFLEVNLLIQPHSLDAVRNAFSACGLMSLLPSSKLTDYFLIPKFRLPLYINRLLTLFVNTQTSFFSPFFANQFNNETLWLRIRPLQYQNLELKQLSQEDFLLYLCAKYSPYKLGLKELADIYNCLAYWKNFDWQEFKLRLAETGLLDSAYRILSLCQAIYHLESVQIFLTAIQEEVTQSVQREVEFRTEVPETILGHRSTLVDSIEKTFALYSLTENPLEKGYLAARIFRFIFFPPKKERALFFFYHSAPAWWSPLSEPFVAPIKILSFLSKIYGIRNVLKSLLQIPAETSMCWLRFFFRLPSRGLRQKAEQNGINLQDLGPLLSN